MLTSVTVTYSNGDWVVGSEALPERLTFPTGARAEAAGHFHARRMARAGRPLVLEVFARDGTLAGRTQYAPPNAA